MISGGFTLVEILIAITLTGLLFAILNGVLTGLVRIGSRTTEAIDASRRLEYCVELLRRELGELRLIPTDPQMSLLGGRGLLIFTTTRSELIARTEVPRGLVRVEWRHLPEKRLLQRTVYAVASGVHELGRMVTVDLLTQVEDVTFSSFDGLSWTPFRGVLEPASCARAIGFDITYAKGESPLFQPGFSTAFRLPEADLVDLDGAKFIKKQ
ncbi:MAG: prepilin-type N-terminal cleavage/methylation domain-containing protein [Candidatus Ozemobacteraceae bacterium]